MRRILLASIALAALATGMEAAAQQPGQDGSSVPITAVDDAAAANGLADIVVTAQRRAENLQRAAVAVGVVTGSELANAGITQPERLSERVPALTIQGTSSGNLIFVRGVGNFTLTPNSDPATAFNYDGVYVGRPTSTTGTFYDLERIEVLKGPQGTLYGRNATAGAINVLPVQPKLGELSGYVSASYGNYDAKSAEGAINLPMGTQGALRISGNIVDRDGYLRDGTSDEKVRALRVQMKSDLTPDLTVRISGDYAHLGGVGAGTSYLYNYNYSPLTGQYGVVPSNLSLAEGTYSPASQLYRRTVPVPALGRLLDTLSPYPFQNNDYFGANAQIDYKTGIGTLTLVPAWRYANIDNVAGAGFAIGTREKDEQFSVEARLTGDRIGIFDYTLGLFYYDEKIRSRQAVGVSTAINFLNNRYATQSYAAFGRWTAHLTDSLRVVGGLRYTHDSKTVDGRATGLALACLVRVAGRPACPTAPLIPYAFDIGGLPLPVPAAGGPPVPLGASGAILARTDTTNINSLDFHRVTYRGALEFDVGPRSLLYASVETGYRSGGFNGAAGFATYQPEFITAYTIGSKNRFFDNKLQLNVEAFWWRYRDQQLSYLSLDANLRPANITTNVGKSDIKGVEAEAQLLATRTTLLRANVQYLDAQYKRFTYQVPNQGAPPFTGCPVSVAANPALFNVNCGGFPAFNAPKWTVNLGAQQTIEIGDFKVIGAIDTQYKSSRYIFFQYQPGQFVGDTWLTNGQIGLSPANDGWTISAFVRNIENNRIPVFAPPHPTINLLPVQTSAPRTYGVRVTASF